MRRWLARWIARMLTDIPIVPVRMEDVVAFELTPTEMEQIHDIVRSDGWKAVHKILKRHQQLSLTHVVTSTDDTRYWQGVYFGANEVERIVERYGNYRAHSPDAHLPGFFEQYARGAKTGSYRH